MHVTYKEKKYIANIILREKIQTLDCVSSSDFVWGTVI